MLVVQRDSRVSRRSAGRSEWYLLTMWLGVVPAAACGAHECPDPEEPPIFDCEFREGHSKLGGEPMVDATLKADGETVVIEYSREDGTALRVTYAVEQLAEWQQ